MKVKLFANLRLITKDSFIELDSPSDVRSLCELLSDKYGKKFREVVFDKDGNLAQGIIILVNGENVHLLNGLNTALKDDDNVSIFPSIGGG